MADEYVLKSSVLNSIHSGDIDMGMVTLHEYRLLKDLSERIDRRIQKVPVADVVPVVRCKDCKSNGEDDGWVWTGGVQYPQPWVSVQVYLPEMDPMPTVREGYVIDEGEGIPTGWFIPALREGRLLYEIEAWKPMSEPPKMTW